jgi:hypothetical protein
LEEQTGSCAIQNYPPNSNLVTCNKEGLFEFRYTSGTDVDSIFINIKNSELQWYFVFYNSEMEPNPPYINIADSEILVKLWIFDPEDNSSEYSTQAITPTIVLNN